MNINCKGELIDLSSPKVMGILNITPDSFFDGGRYITKDKVFERVGKMLEEGADFIDIGGYSTRPAAAEVSEQEEIDRTASIIEDLVNDFSEIKISIDTFRAKVAEEAIKAGACMINDVSGGTLDDKMFETVARLRVPYVLMHMKETPQTMQENPTYEDVTIEVNLFLSEKITKLRALGVSDIILDPGFGFAKNQQHNYELLNNLDKIGYGKFPLLVGVSRKSMVYKALNTTADLALNGTTVLNTIALQKGASILRVHDVKQARETIRLLELTLSSK